jgi:hypothetical protein
MKNHVLCVLGAALVLTALSGSAQFAIDWFSVDGGGGTSSGGAYALSGTIGQPDAGPMTGGRFTLTGGFWALVAAIPEPGAPALNVSLGGGMVTLSWSRDTGGYLLDRTATLSGPSILWLPVLSPYQTNETQIFVTLPVSPNNQFYRLRKP